MQPNTVHVLACFGGAGPQHTCAVAQMLGMRTMLHRHGGVLSMNGNDAANAMEECQSPSANVWDNDDSNDFAPLIAKATQTLTDQGYLEDNMQGQPRYDAGEQRRLHFPAEL